MTRHVIAEIRQRADPLEMRVSCSCGWSACDFDGQPVSTSRELAFLFAEHRRQAGARASTQEEP